MKRKSLLIALLFLGVGVAQAQSGIQVGLRAGYAFPSPGNVIGQMDVDQANGNSSTEVINGTIGTAIPITVEGRFMFTEHIGAQLDLTYSKGVAKDVYTYEDESSDNQTTVSVYSDQFRLSPQAVLFVDGFYTRVGFVIPVAGKTTQEQATTGTGFEFNMKQETTGRPTLGYTGAIGYEIVLSDNICFFGEFEMLSLNITGDEREVVEYEVNGTTDDDEIKTYNLVDSIDNNSDPDDRLTSSQNFSSFGIMLGIKLAF